MTFMNPIWAADNANLADDAATYRANYLAWKQHAQRLENSLENIKRVSQAWQDEAIQNGANSYAANVTFKEVFGKSVREHLGDEETDRRIAEGIKVAKEEYGI